MERGRQRRGPQTAFLAVASQDERLEPRLQLELVGKAGAASKFDERGAARKEHVLTVVDFDAVDFERRRTATEQAAAFEELDVRAELLQFNRGGETGEAGSDHGYALESHDFTITRSFSVGARAAR